jgi:lambda family phage minor tail protein L
MDVNTAIASSLQSVDPSAVIELFKLTLVREVHCSAGQYYFHAGVNQLETPIIWRQQEYIPLPVKADGFEWDGQGSLPRPKIRIANVLGTITSLILTLPNGLEGAKLERFRTLARFLDAENFPDGNPEADPDAAWAPEVYYVDRKAAETSTMVEFELASAFDLVGVRAPKRQCINLCQWDYRGVECGYTSRTYFNEKDERVAEYRDDVCGKRLSSCEVRFGTTTNTQVPFGGFPGIGTYFV